jgi:hypothetical protein
MLCEDDVIVDIGLAKYGSQHAFLNATVRQFPKGFAK